MHICIFMSATLNKENVPASPTGAMGNARLKNRSFLPSLFAVLPLGGLVKVTFRSLCPNLLPASVIVALSFSLPLKNVSLSFPWICFSCDETDEHKSADSDGLAADSADRAVGR